MDAYTSQESLIVAKAKEKGIDILEVNKVFERELRRVTDECGGDGRKMSASWRLARAEEGVWGFFFPGELFPTVTQKQELVDASTPVKGDRNRDEEHSSPFPKALQGRKNKGQAEYGQGARREWVHDRYRQESPTRMKMEKDSYRPIRELDSYRPQLEGETRPMGRSDPEKPATSMSGGNADRVALRTMPNGGTTRVFSPAAEDNKPYRSQRDVIYQKAVAAGVSRKEVEACLEEKAGVAEKKFAERSGDWQMFFVEASTWGRFFKGVQFPGIEPPKHQVQTKVLPAPPVPSDQPSPLLEYAAGVSERLMEGKTNSQAERREFFQYLQKMRTYSRLQHPTKSCDHIRGWFADNLTWQHFFGPEPYPFAQPPGKPFAGCAACLLLPKFARLQGGAMKKVIGLITAHGPTPKPQPAKKGPSKVPTAPKAPRSTIAPTADNFTKREPLKDAKTILAHPVSESGTGPRQLEPPVLQAPTTLPAGIQQTKSDPPSAAMSRRDSRTPPPTTSTRSAPRGTDFHPQSVVPAGLSAQLAQIWAQNPFLGKGTVVMQNTVPAVFNKAFVGELFNCFASDTKQAIAAIGEELMCHIHYYVISTGDLFLWTEPHIPGDVGSFNRGHIFITGWVARISSFGMVKPSVHWNAIRTPLAPLQAQPSTIAQPRNTADSLSLLVDYVDNASAVEQKCSVAEKSEFPDPGPPYDLETRKPVWLQVAIKQQQALGAASTRTPIISTKYPSAFEDPEKQWQRYMVAFRTSDVDRLIVEEAVKNEGNLRMIFDKESGQIVSVEELIKRTVYRCSLKEAKSAGTGELGSGDVSFRNGDENKNMKRKLEDGNRDEDGDGKNGRQEKRACL